MAGETPTTQVPTQNPKQATTPPTSTPNYRSPWGRNKLESGLRPKGNGKAPSGTFRK